MIPLAALLASTSITPLDAGLVALPPIHQRPGTAWMDEAADFDLSDVLTMREYLDRNPIDPTQVTGFVDADGWHPKP